MGSAAQLCEFRRQWQQSPGCSELENLAKPISTPNGWNEERDKNGQRYGDKYPFHCRGVFWRKPQHA